MKLTKDRCCADVVSFISKWEERAELGVHREETRVCLLAVSLHLRHNFFYRFGRPQVAAF